MRTNPRITASISALLEVGVFTFADEEFTVGLRKHGIQTKEPLYLFNVSKMCYVSSLKEIGENLFSFTTEKKGVTETYNLKNDNGTIKIEKIA